MGAPYEIIAAPFEIWLAATGSTFTDVSATPSGAWVKLGTSGNKNYSEDGIEVSHEQTIETFRPLGLTAARKAFRTEEELVITMTLVDMTAAEYAKILNRVSVTAVVAASGVGGQSTIPLLQGLEVSTFMLICKGAESAGGVFSTQFQVPLVYQASSPKPKFAKGEPAGLECEFRALWDSSLGFGKYVSQTAAAS